MARQARQTAMLLAAAVSMVVAACSATTPSPSAQGAGPTAALVAPPSASAPSAVSATASPTAVSATASPTASPTTTPSPSPTGTVTVSLPVTRCHTTTGNGPAPEPPASVTAVVDAADQGRIAAYGDGVDLILGPAGFSCTAEIGADGSTGATIVSPDDPNDLVDLRTTGACQGCAVLQGCPLFAAAAKASADYGNCTGFRPPEEVVKALNSDVITFRDDPGVTGTGVSSGVWNASTGLVWYRSDAGMLSAGQLSCTLDAGRADLCTSIVANALASLPSPARPGSPARIAPASGWPPESCGLQAPSPDQTLVVLIGADRGSCDLAKHDLLPWGVFKAVDVAAGAPGLAALCVGGHADWGGAVQVWDSGGQSLGTRICQKWDLVAP